MTENKQYKTIITEKILVVADDLTGACDTGVQFSKRNFRTSIIISSSNIGNSFRDCDVLVVDTESRFDDREAAYRKAYETGLKAKSENIKHIYKKLDSTMRGNPGAEIAGLMDSLDIKHTFLVPALPLYGRTTINGNVYVRGVLLSETEFANDPKNPVKESYIPEILAAQTDKKTSVINFNDLHAGRIELSNKINELMDSGIRIIVIDAEDDEDLDLTASVLAGIDGRVMFSGCSGLAEKLALYINLEREKKSTVVIAGSVNKITADQVEHASGELSIRMIEIDAGKIVSGDNCAEKRRISELAQEAITAGGDLIIRSISSKEAAIRSLEKGKEAGQDAFRVSDKIANFLGELAAEIIEQNNLKGIVLTGGDTAFNTLQALNINGIIIKNEILHGIPYGHFNDERYRDLIVVTKAGGFGEKDAIVRILNYLRNV